MRTLVGLGVALVLAGGLYAQRGNYVNAQPVVTGGFGNVVFPGGTAATVPGMQRTTGNFVSPLGSGPRVVIPNNQAARQQRRSTAVYAYPVYVGGYGYSGYDSYAEQPQQQQQQPNVTVVYPPQPAPVIINQFGPAESARPRMYEMPPAPRDDASASAPETTHYLLAFKDHTIYSAENYWVDGDTLHYFTAGNTHNQVSLSLIDRELTTRLNKESGVEVKLPAEK